MGVEVGPNGQVPPEVALSDIDLGSWDFWGLSDDIRDGAFRTLRREAPIAFFPELARTSSITGSGHWALTRYEDVLYASRHPEIFSSNPSITMADPVSEVAEYLDSMIMLDDPCHQRLRSIVSRSFTPRVLALAEASVRARAQRLVSDFVAAHPDGRGDLVSEVAAPLPLQVICDMMGIVSEDHRQIFQWTNAISSSDDPATPAVYERYTRALKGLGDYGQNLADDRRGAPRDDLTTSLVQATVHGDSLTSGEIAAFFVLLVFAGAETTRTAISHGVLALTRYPEQRRLWWEDFDAISGTAVEEIVRWSTPVIYMRRTLTRDHVLDGIAMSAGDKVTMWYSSANRDESMFDDPWTFDVRRDPNPHVGYGAGGVHFCLGANLARREIAAVFQELHRQTPDIVAAEEPERLLSPFINSISALTVAWPPARG